MNHLPHTQLDFPLNVYAHCIYIQQGSVDYLHFGFVEADEDAWTVGAQLPQERSTALLLDNLLPAPCHILEIGLGLGTTASLLIERGYQVTAMSPDAAQVSIAQQKSAKLTAHCQRFEEFQAAPETYDCILLQESAQYIRDLGLFNKAFDLLKPEGQMLLVDEFSILREFDDAPEGLHYLPFFIAHAERCGFSKIAEQDLSARAAPTVDYLLTAIDLHRTRLLAELPISEEMLAGLVSHLQRYRQHYQGGKYGYYLLKFNKIKAPRWRLTEVTAAEQDTVRGLFYNVFEHELSREMWHWKYGDGRGMAIAAWQGAYMVAHYGGILREISYFGVPKTAVQIADVMVASKERGMLTRQGAYFLTGATFPETYAGYASPVLLGFGFPTARAIRTAEKLGLYSDVGKIVEMHWDVLNTRPALKTRIRHLQPVEIARDQVIIDQLWAEMQQDFPDAMMGVKNWEFVQHRYYQHPHKHYELLLVFSRFTGKALGIAVILRDGALCKLMDVIAPRRNLSLLLTQVRRMAGRWGMESVKAWITENYAPVFTHCEGTAHPTDVRIPHCVCYVGPETETVRGHWWLMWGDTDFM
jgi:SAM-dependent methyltransferase